MKAEQKTHYNQKKSLFSRTYKLTHKIHLDHLKTLASLVEACSRPSDSLIEVGCGEGLVAEFIDRKILLTDISLQRCQSNHPKREWQIPKPIFKNKEFDVCFEISTLHHLADMNEAISELRRISKKTIFIEPNIFNPEILFLSLLNIKYEPHYFEMGEKNLRSKLSKHFDKVSLIKIFEPFHYLLLLIPPEFIFLFNPLLRIFRFHSFNVFVCQDKK